MSDVTEAHLPLRVFGAPLCSRCQEVVKVLEARCLALDKRLLNPAELLVGAPAGDMWEAASVLAITTLQDGLMPVVLTQDWNSFIQQERIK